MSKPRYPYLPVTRWWAALVQERRKARGWSQDKLAARVECNQASISNIESAIDLEPDAQLRSTTDGERVAEVLGIDLPIIEVADDFDHQWIRLGRAVRERNPAASASLLALLASLVAADRKP